MSTSSRGAHVNKLESPTVSVVIPTYNRAHLLVRSIQSVLNQSYQDFEIIVVDDGSTDNTEEVIKSFNDERVKYIRHEGNKGNAAARNTGIKVAKGEYVAFQDSDDEWLPKKLEKQVNLLRSLPETFAVVYSGFYKIVDGEKFYIPSSEIYPREGNIHSSLLKGNFIGTPSILVRKSALLCVGFFDEKLPRLVDWDLVIRLSKKYQFKLIDEPLFVAYYTNNSLSTYNEILIYSLEVIIKKFNEDFDKHPDAKALQYFTLGKYSCVEGHAKEAKKYFLLALKMVARPKYFLSFILFSIFGVQGFSIFWKFYISLRKLRRKR
jgi:glycosyltransferase involved in cell wall biosynthesis